MAILLILVLLALLIGWAYGEFANLRGLRILCSVSCLVLCVGSASVIAGISVRFQTTAELTQVFDRYHQALAVRVDQGDTEFVLSEIQNMHQHVPPTYETGAFLRRMETAISRVSLSEP